QAALLPWAFQITAGFGHYPPGWPYYGAAHYGLDLAATYGVVQTAPVGGVVEDVLRRRGQDLRAGLGQSRLVAVRRNRPPYPAGPLREAGRLGAGRRDGQGRRGHRRHRRDGLRR